MTREHETAVSYAFGTFAPQVPKLQCQDGTCTYTLNKHRRSLIFSLILSLILSLFFDFSSKTVIIPRPDAILIKSKLGYHFESFIKIVL